MHHFFLSLLTGAPILLERQVLMYPTAIGSEPENPSYNSYPHWCRTMLGHSGANIIPVVASNRIGTETFAKSAITFYGGSFISGDARLGRRWMGPTASWAPCRLQAFNARLITACLGPCQAQSRVLKWHRVIQYFMVSWVVLEPPCPARTAAWMQPARTAVWMQPASQPISLRLCEVADGSLQVALAAARRRCLPGPCSQLDLPALPASLASLLIQVSSAMWWPRLEGSPRMGTSTLPLMHLKGWRWLSLTWMSSVPTASAGAYSVIGGQNCMAPWPPRTEDVPGHRPLPDAGKLCCVGASQQYRRNINLCLSTLNSHMPGALCSAMVTQCMHNI